MTILAKQDFEAGTVGSSIATGSGGGGNTGIAVTGTAPIITATAGEFVTGSKAAKAQAAAGAASAMNMPLTSTTIAGTLQERFFYIIDAALWASTVDETIHTLRANAANRINMVLRGSDKRLVINDATGSWVSPSPMNGAGVYQVDLSASTGTTSTAPYDGKMTFQVTKKADGAFAAGMTAAVELTARNNGVGAVWTNVNIGALSTTSTPARTPGWDDVQVGDQYGFLPSATVNAGPVASIMSRPAPQAPGTVTVTGAATDDVAVTSLTVVIDSGPTLGQTTGLPTVTNTTNNLNTASATVSGTFTAAPGKYRVHVTAVDGAGVTSYSSIQTVDVYALSNADVLVYEEISGTYTAYGSAGSDVGALNDADLTTGLQSGLAPAAEKQRVRMCPYGPGDIYIKYTHDQTPTSPQLSVQLTGYKEDGTTQIWQTTIPAPLVAGQEDTLKLDTAALAAVPALTDRRGLIFESSATQ